MLEEAAITVGAGSVVKANHPDACLKFVEHSGAAIQAGRMPILDLEDRMRQAGAELLLIKPDNITESQTLADNEHGACALRKVAENIEDAADQRCSLWRSGWASPNAATSRSTRISAPPPWRRPARSCC